MNDHALALSHKHLQSLLSDLESRASSLIAAPEIDTMIANMDGLTEALAEVGRSVQGLDRKDATTSRIRALADEALTHLQRSLIYAESRLQHERSSLQHQLHDLSIQLEWAKLSRETT